MENINQNNAHSRAIYKVKRIKRFYKHLAAYIIVNTLILVLKFIRSLDRGETFVEAFLDINFYGIWLLWGIGLAFHAFCVFGTDYFFGKNWEENKIIQFMEEDERNVNSNKK